MTTMTDLRPTAAFIQGMMDRDVTGSWVVRTQDAEALVRLFVEELGCSRERLLEAEDPVSMAADHSVDGGYDRQRSTCMVLSELQTLEVFAEHADLVRWVGSRLNELLEIAV